MPERKIMCNTVILNKKDLDRYVSLDKDDDAFLELLDNDDFFTLCRKDDPTNLKVLKRLYYFIRGEDVPRDQNERISPQEYGKWSNVNSPRPVRRQY